MQPSRVMLMPKVRRPIRAILFHNAAENQIDPGERLRFMTSYSVRLSPPPF
jgi:hypothetical protein